MPKKKPLNPDLKIIYPGMKNPKDKRHKNAGHSNNAKIKRPDLIPVMKARKGTSYKNNIPEIAEGYRPQSHCQATGKLSAYQRRTHTQFMKVRVGETREQWLHRTRFRRLLTPEECQTSISRKKIIYPAAIKPRNDKLSRRRNNSQKALDKYIMYQVTQKDYGFLRNYIFVANWACVRYNISLTDLEIGMLFYNNVFPFSKEQFDRRLCMTPKPQGNFTRFKRLGYLREVIDTKRYFEKTVKKKTGLYLLSPTINRAIKAMYDKLVLVGNFGLIGQHVDYKKVNLRTPQEKEVQEEIKKMYVEFMDIIEGNKEPEKYIENEEEN